MGDLAADPLCLPTVVRDLGQPAPAPPSARNWLGTDDQARDVLARVIYGFRISVLFGFTLTIVSLGRRHRRRRGAGLSTAAGSTCLFQRFIEIWSGMPQLYLLIILASVDRAELLDPAGLPAAVLLDGADRRGAGGIPARPQPRLRPRGAARSACPTRRLMARHILPNAMVATLTFLPFILSGSVTVLASLDFLGFGLPPGSPSLGELRGAGQEQPAGALAGASPASSCWAAC